MLTALVICLHVAIACGSADGWHWREVDDLSRPLRMVLTVFTAVCQAFFMGVFFLLAGYTPLSLARKGLVWFTQDRLLRLGVPLLAYGLLIGPIAIAMAREKGWDRFVEILIRLLYKGTFNWGPLWFAQFLVLRLPVPPGLCGLAPPLAGTNRAAARAAVGLVDAGGVAGAAGAAGRGRVMTGLFSGAASKRSAGGLIADAIYALREPVVAWGIITVLLRQGRLRLNAPTQRWDSWAASARGLHRASSLRRRAVPVAARLVCACAGEVAGRVIVVLGGVVLRRQFAASPAGCRKGALMRIQSCRGLSLPCKLLCIRSNLAP
jgi:hypothetical protein